MSRLDPDPQFILMQLSVTHCIELLYKIVIVQRTALGVEDVVTLVRMDLSVIAVKRADRVVIRVVVSAVKGEAKTVQLLR